MERIQTLRSQVGRFSKSRSNLTYKNIEIFAIMSGDINPMHVDNAFAESDTLS